MAAFDYSRATCREAAAECNKPKTAAVLASAKTVAAVERLAKADRRLAATVDQWDADPWLLNTPGGVIDLQTGLQRPHQPDDYMTKITAVAPRRHRADMFLPFLDRSMAGDAELDRLPAAPLRLRPDRLHPRARAGLLLRHRRQRQEPASSTPSPASWATITGRRRSRPSPPPTPTGIRPTSPGCAARVS